MATDLIRHRLPNILNYFQPSEASDILLNRFRLEISNRVPSLPVTYYTILGSLTNFQAAASSTTRPWTGWLRSWMSRSFITRRSDKEASVRSLSQEITFKNATVVILGCPFGILSEIAISMGAKSVVGLAVDEVDLDAAALRILRYRSAIPCALLCEGRDFVPEKSVDFLIVHWSDRLQKRLRSLDKDVLGVLLRRSSSVLGIESLEEAGNLRTLANQFSQRKYNYSTRDGLLMVQGGVTADRSPEPDGTVTLFSHKPINSRAVSQEEVFKRIEEYMQAPTQVQSTLHLEDYRRLMASLVGPKSRFKNVPLAQFASARDSHHVVFGIRHDVDFDIRTCVPMSELETQLGLSSTYFILHNNPAYYGVYLHGGIFVRFSSMVSVYKKIQDHGQELGLHIDPLGTIGEFRVDGIDAMRAELNYLRHLGLAVSGVCAHNSQSVYNVDNKDVFAGQNASGENSVVTEFGCRVELGALALVDWGIDYVADFNRTVAYVPLTKPYISPFSFRVDRVPVYEFDYDVGFSIISNGMWEVNCADDKLNAGHIPHVELISHLESLPLGTKILFNIHPEYFGKRIR